ncbi:hypothetical protein NLU13_0758 [Sarocladium strictum]|uniref:NAD-dependent epimerase/dehydratase domain-containing protein n=1 Tax=Sarocladium strictum TaxID=5046 RepID=A0AA39GSF3_SARSR|nr:hypothetical protein NLU13_0758 [Sarocladium strictum]
MDDKDSPVLVTGGSGYVASALVQGLLRDGYSVRTTVRSLKNHKKVAPLRALQQDFPGKLELFEADLLEPRSFDAAMVGCSVVHHVASPFRMLEKIVDGQKEMVEPALEGVRSVLGSVERTPTVRRVKMQDQTLSEEYFNESSTVEHDPYHYSKVLAEKEAWKLYEAQETKRWHLVAINPGLVLGPSLTSASESGSLFLLDELLSGQLFFGVPDLNFVLVDVRDVVAAHSAAQKVESAHGRYIVAQDRMTPFLEMAKVARSQATGFRKVLIPTHKIPTWVVRLVGPLFGLNSKFIREHIGIRFSVNNQRSITELGVSYRPVEETLRDHSESWAKMRAK